MCVLVDTPSCDRAILSSFRKIMHSASGMVGIWVIVCAESKEGMFLVLKLTRFCVNVLTNQGHLYTLKR